MTPLPYTIEASIRLTPSPQQAYRSNMIYEERKIIVTPGSESEYAEGRSGTTISKTTWPTLLGSLLVSE